MAEEEITSNTYEDARKKQLLENKKRFEDLGILNISKSLSDLSKSEKKSKQREGKTKIRNAPVIEPRRSTRARNPIPTYRDDLDIGLPPVRRKSNSSSSWTSYIVRPLEECRIASYEERVHAVKCAEKVQSNLQSEYPSFVKSMVRSHVYSCFWLGLPMHFCKKHLPKSTVSMVLEDEDGHEYDAVFISGRTGLSGGWRAFALEHKIDDGDALVFELVERTRFKIYIVKASDSGNQVEEEAAETKKTSKIPKRLKGTPDESAEKGKKPTDGDEEAAETKKTSKAPKRLKGTPDKSAEKGKKPTDGEDEEAAETKKTSKTPKRLKRALNKSTENGEEAAETKRTSLEPKRRKRALDKSAQNGQKPVDGEEEAAETKKTSMEPRRSKRALDKSAQSGQKPVDGEEEAAETKKTSVAPKSLKRALDKSAEKGQKPTAKNSHQDKKPNKLKETVTASRRSARKRNEK